MSKKNGLPVGAVIGFLVGLFAINTNDAAFAASECLASPNRESGPGTHWHYRINQATKERCWYLKKVGDESRPRPTGVANAKQSRGAAHTASAARVAPVETAAPAESESPIKAWFTATFSALSGSNATSAESGEPPASEPPRKRRSSAERSESSRTARAQQRSSASATTAEAAADKDVATAATERETEWQKALYEEFLEWRVRQLLFQ